MSKDAKAYQNPPIVLHFSVPDIEAECDFTLRFLFLGFESLRITRRSLARWRRRTSGAVARSAIQSYDKDSVHLPWALRFRIRDLLRCRWIGASHLE